MANKFTIWINDNVDLKGLKGIPAVVDGIKQKVHAVFTGLAIGAVAALTASFWQLTKAVKDFAQQELGEVDLSSALIQMGQHTEEYQQKLINLASQYQKTTNVGDEMWLKAFGQLTRFGMTSANVDQVAEALKNLTGLMDGNFSSAVMAMQRAMEGEFGMFSRYGITLDLTGDKVADLNNLMSALAEKGGGLMEARVETLSGKWTALQNAISDFREEVGRVLTESLGLKDGLGTLVEWIEKLTESAKSGALHDFLEGAGARIRAIGEQIKVIAGKIRSIDDLAVVAEVAGTWLKDKLIEGGKQLAAFLIEKAPLIGNVIGKAVWEAIKPGSKDSMTDDQTAAAREAATAGGQYKVYSREWRENYQNIRQQTESENRVNRLRGEGQQAEVDANLSETTVQSFGDMLNTALDAHHEKQKVSQNESSVQLNQQLEEFLSEASDEQLRWMEQLARDILTGPSDGSEQMVRVAIPEGEFIGDAEKTQAFLESLEEADLALLDMLIQAEESKESAATAAERTGESLKAAQESNSLIQQVMSSFIVSATSTAHVAKATQSQLGSVVGLVNSISAGQIALQEQIASLESRVRSLRA